MAKKTGVTIHPSSVVHPKASIGEGARIWHFSHVMEGARVGKNCILGQNVFVGRNVRIGDGSKVQNNVSLYEGVELAEDVFCGPSCVFTNVETPRSHVSRKNEYACTKVGRGATIGANATVVCGNSIGEYAFIGAGAVVTRDVPAYALCYGVPARVRGWACSCGEILTFRGGKTACKRCGAAYLKKRDGVRKAS
jgi:UDP-2-acetamido-3-amino-2,3-dideoxy-glucuronate N-acetyltransferase